MSLKFKAQVNVSGFGGNKFLAPYIKVSPNPSIIKNLSKVIFLGIIPS
jgi:hypothetical protein